MSMQIGTPDDDEVLNTINTTPLVDVMLVLLIIFLITIPVVTTSVNVKLPNETLRRYEAKPDNVIISIDKNGGVYLYDTPMKDADDLRKRLQKIAQMKPQPDVQIRADVTTDFAPVNRVVTALQQAGIHKVGFITEPASPSSMQQRP